MAERLFGRSSHGLEANLTRFGDAGQSSIEKTCQKSLLRAAGTLHTSKP